MSIIKKSDLNELVGGDIYSSGGQRNVISNSEIETGPVDKPFNDKSYYEKGEATTTDKVFARYRQNIPWFAQYSFGGSRANSGVSDPIASTFDTIKTNDSVGTYNPDDESSVTETINKKTMEERIDDLVKRSKNSDVTDKNYNSKVDKISTSIENEDLNDEDLNHLLTLINNKRNNTNKSKNL